MGSCRLLPSSLRSWRHSIEFLSSPSQHPAEMLLVIQQLHRSTSFCCTYKTCVHPSHHVSDAPRVCFYVFSVRSNSSCVRTYFQTTVSRQERIARERERERESIDFIVERDFSEIWIKNKGYFCKGSWGEECISIPSRESFNYFCIVTIFVGIIRLLF